MKNESGHKKKYEFSHFLGAFIPFNLFLCSLLNFMPFTHFQHPEFKLPEYLCGPICSFLILISWETQLTWKRNTFFCWWSLSKPSTPSHWNRNTIPPDLSNSSGQGITLLKVILKLKVDLIQDSEAPFFSTPTAKGRELMMISTLFRINLTQEIPDHAPFRQKFLVFWEPNLISKN